MPSEYLSGSIGFSSIRYGDAAGKRCANPICHYPRECTFSEPPPSRKDYEPLSSEESLFQSYNLLVTADEYLLESLHEPDDV